MKVQYFIDNVKTVVLTSLSVVCLMIFSQRSSYAQSANRDTIALPQIEVLEQKDSKIFKNIPGSVSVLSEKDLQRIAPVSAIDVFRKIPGLNVIDEDGGAGLRVNIGVRGLNPIRTSKVLILEDGIPLTLNPYGEPQMYYSPIIDRMAGVEVLKGSGQLEFGPQTIGGVINYVSALPPLSATNRVKLSGGENGFFSGYVSHGNTIGNVGYLLSYSHKRADNMGPLSYRVNNINAKIHLKVNDRSSIGFKFGIDDQKSNATYVGLTQPLYEAGNHDFTKLAPDDYMPVRNVNASITHLHRFTDNVELKTTAFAYTISRNWRRQAYDRAPNASRTYSQIWGDPEATDGSSLFMRDAADWRNRQYEVKGVEPRLAIKHQLFQINNTLKTGVRTLWERADEQFIQSNTKDGWGGNMRDDEERTGFATSAYVMNQMQITEKLSANVGIRIENYEFERHIRRGRYTINGENNVVRDTSDRKRSSTFAFLPGAGLNYTFNENVSLFAGVHRGFAPPQVKSAILPDGVAADIDKEVSTNYELGARIAIGDYFTVSPTAFYLDFENQVVPVSAASGATSVNGGKTKHKGVEFDFQYDIAKSLGARQSVVIGGSYTYTDARFAGAENVLEDNYLPYSPKHIINHFLSVELVNGFGFSVYGNYLSKQYNDNANTEVPTVDGQIGAIGARYLIDATINYTLRQSNISFFVSGKNLGNRRYISSRNPQGIRLGMDRFISAGLDISF